MTCQPVAVGKEGCDASEVSPPLVLGVIFSKRCHNGAQNPGDPNDETPLAYGSRVSTKHGTPVPLSYSLTLPMLAHSRGEVTETSDTRRESGGGGGADVSCKTNAQEMALPAMQSFGLTYDFHAQERLCLCIQTSIWSKGLLISVVAA